MKLKEQYQTEVLPALVKQFNYTSVMQAPRLEKIVVNMGVGEAISNAKVLDDAVADMTQITGQKPVITKAKKSIANFKLREEMPIGCKVTLRGDKMYDFLEKVIKVALPRVRDFRGISGSSFDGRGNYTFGLKEQIIFPEIDYDKISKVRGMDITIVTTASTDQEGYALLKEFGMPFKKEYNTWLKNQRLLVTSNVKKSLTVMQRNALN